MDYNKMSLDELKEYADGNLPSTAPIINTLSHSKPLAE